MRIFAIAALVACAVLAAGCSALPSWMGGGPSISRITIVDEPGGEQQWSRSASTSS